jgi:arylsulfatase A-like enzyme
MRAFLHPLAIGLLVFAVVGMMPARAAEPVRRPNVIIFLADDLGYGELGMQGNKEIPTPHIDSIAKAGVRFTSGYVSGPYCSPTRAGLMTGRYQTRFGHEFNEGQPTPGGSQFGLPLTEKTIADHFKEMGYATCAIGKWHLGRQPEYFPRRRGFDEFFGTVGNTAFLNPQNFIDSRKSDEVTPIKDDAFYTTEAYRERAVDWIEKHKDQPYLLYLPFNAQHAPLQATEKYLARFAEIADEKRRIFAAMLSAMDDAIGAVLQKVRELGQEENTLIFFLADNGGPTAQTTSKNTPLRGNKATTWEGGVRVPFAVQWKGRIPSGVTYNNPVIQLDILPTALAATGRLIDRTWEPDGVDLMPFLSPQTPATTETPSARPHETLYWRFGQQWAIRHGDWKLVVSNEPMKLARKDKPASLFNLADDISEAKDLAADQPEKVKELRALWEKWNAQQQPPRWLPVPNAQKGKGKQKQKNNKGK